MNSESSQETGEPRASTFIEQARRAQIIGAAIATIAELGYAKASLAEIAAHAGISKGVILYYFRNKDELIRQVVRSVLEGGLAAMRPAIAAETTARARLRAYITANLAYMREHRAEIGVVVAVFSANRGGGKTPLVDEELATAGVVLARQIIVEGQASGEFRPCSAQVTAMALRAALDMAPPYLAADPSMDTEAYASELIALFERGLGAQEAGGQLPS